MEIAFHALVSASFAVLLSCGGDSGASRLANAEPSPPSAPPHGLDGSGKRDAAHKGCIEDQDAGPLSLVCPVTMHCQTESPAPIRIRLASWNIKVGSVLGLDAVVAALKTIDADIVLLQEVDQGVERTGVVNQASALATALGHRYVFAPTLELQGGQYGIALLSRLPMQMVARIPISNRQAAEPRTAIEAYVCTGAQTLRMINHHADYVLEGAERSVLELLDSVSTTEQSPTLFAGDFNQEPRDRGPMACVERGLVDVLGKFDPSPTQGGRRIDYVFANPLAAGLIDNAHVVTSDASDHFILVVDLRVPAF